MSRNYEFSPFTLKLFPKEGPLVFDKIELIELVFKCPQIPENRLSMVSKPEDHLVFTALGAVLMKMVYYGLGSEFYHAKSFAYKPYTDVALSKTEFFSEITSWSPVDSLVYMKPIFEFVNRDILIAEFKSILVDKYGSELLSSFLYRPLIDEDGMDWSEIFQGVPLCCSFLCNFILNYTLRSFDSTFTNDFPNQQFSRYITDIFVPIKGSFSIEDLDSFLNKTGLIQYAHIAIIDKGGIPFPCQHAFIQVDKFGN